MAAITYQSVDGISPIGTEVLSTLENETLVNYSNLIKDSHFENNGFWTLFANWAYSGSSVEHTPGNTIGINSDVIPLVEDIYYKITYTIHGMTAGNVTALFITGGNSNGATRSSNGEHKEVLIAKYLNDKISFGPSSDFDGKITNVRVEQCETIKINQWTDSVEAVANSWASIAYGNNIFVAVSFSGTGDRVMTSPDGITWTSRTSAADNSWFGIAYGNNIFVAVSTDGTGNRVMTSPDGITWTSRTSANNYVWSSIAYGNNIFVAVSTTGTGNRVMTSPDGITWTSRTSAADNSWQGVAYGNNTFVAVATSGTGNRVMTSPDGITWTIRTSANDNFWRSVTYGKGLFVAVAQTGTGDRVMTSPNGITWTIRTSAEDNDWLEVTYGNGLFVAVAQSGVGNRVMTSPDGITWTIGTSANDNLWFGVTYGYGSFVAVSYAGSNNRVMKLSNDSFAQDSSSIAIGLEVFGDVIKSNVNISTGLVSYGNFSNSNYLEQYYNVSLDFGTGDIAISFWLNVNSGSIIQAIFLRDSLVTAQKIYAYIDASGYFVFLVNDGTTERKTTYTSSIRDSKIRHFVCKYDASIGKVSIYVDKILVASTTGSVLLTLTNTSATLKIGKDNSNQYLTEGNISLFKIMTSITNQQISTMYNNERELFLKGRPFRELNKSYSLGISLSNESSFSEEDSVFTSDSLDGTRDTVFYGGKKVWQAQSSIIPLLSSDELDYYDIKHFISSVKRGQTFTFDERGTIVSDDDKVNVILKNSNISYERLGNLVDHYRFNFEVREA